MIIFCADGMLCRCSVTESKSDMLNDKAIAQCTNSGGLIMCEYLQEPCSTTPRVQDGDGRDKWLVKRTLSSTSVIAS